VEALDIFDPSAPLQWLTNLGIVDAASGHDVAVAHRKVLMGAGNDTLRSMENLTYAAMGFCGFLSRAQGLHERAVAATDARNPYAAFTLVRAYADNMAGILFANDHPKDVATFLGLGDRPYVSAGKLTNYMQRVVPTYKQFYDQLSGYTHPVSLSLLASFKLEAEDTFNWSSAPRFRDEREIMLAYGWIVEVAENTVGLLTAYADTFELRDSPNRWP
jgi:hypothetical protein